MTARRPAARLAAGILALGMAWGMTPAASAGAAPADLCLEVSADALSADAWSALHEGAEAALATRPSLFPAPTFVVHGHRLDVWSGQGGDAPGAASPCLEPGSEWTARFGRSFLEAGADRLLAEAPTTPGIASEVTLEWYPQESRVRTRLDFAGPLDIPNGSCWVDDALTVDRAGGIVVASGEQGLETSLFAEAACGRFFDHLPDGGAGEQAITLLPGSVTTPDGADVRLVASEVWVRDDAIVIAGTIEVGRSEPG